MNRTAAVCLVLAGLAGLLGIGMLLADLARAKQELERQGALKDAELRRTAGGMAESLRQLKAREAELKALGKELKDAEARGRQAVAAQSAAQSELGRATNQLADLGRQLDTLHAFGNAEPRRVYAAYEQTVEQGEVEIEEAVGFQTKWQCETPGEKFPAGRKFQEIKSGRQELARRQGILLGVQSHAAFVLTSLPRAQTLSLLPTAPPSVDLPLMLGLTKNHKYLLQQWLDWRLDFQVQSGGKPLGGANWRVLHAWNPPKNGELTLLLLGCLNVSTPDWHLPLVTKSPADWLAAMERKPQVYPVGLLNPGCALVPLPLSSNYDYAGESLDWRGIPGCLQPVFWPVADFDRPVLHSLLVQLEADRALVFPVQFAKTKLESAHVDFDLAPFFQFKTDVPATASGTHPWADLNNEERRGLVPVFRTLLDKLAPAQ